VYSLGIVLDWKLEGSGAAMSPWALRDDTRDLPWLASVIISLLVTVVRKTSQEWDVSLRILR
jgi:hypothetical protein